jgi:hypothetical protein
MKYWSPDGEHISKLTFEPQSGVLRGTLSAQSGVIQADETSASVLNAPEQDESLGTIAGDQPDAIVGFASGELVSSFRDCMKRYGLIRRLSNDNSVANNTTIFTYFDGWAYPTKRGDTVFGDTALTTMMAYVRLSYAGWRGSIRKSLVPITLANPAKTSLTVCRAAINLTSNSVSTLACNNGVPGLKTSLPLYDSWSGEAIATTQADSLVQFELPWYSIQRFAFNYNGGMTSGLGFRAVLANTNSSGTLQTYNFVMDERESIGEDFNLFFFLGVAPLWYLA